jgi:hypothetical protein
VANETFRRHYVVDHFLDMGRTVTNVLGNAVAVAVVAKWEVTIQAKKLYADGQGRETGAPMSETLDVGSTGSRVRGRSPPRM